MASRLRTATRLLPHRHLFTSLAQAPPNPNATRVRSFRRPLLIATGLTLSTGALLALRDPLLSDSSKNQPAPTDDEDLRSVPLSQLARSWTVYTLCSSSALIDASPTLLHVASKIPGVWQATKAFVRRTFFAQFVGGETAEECIPLMHELRELHGMGVILNYSVEALDSAPTSGSSAIELAISDILSSIDACGSFESSLHATSDPRAGQSFVAVKPSGLVSDPSVLERATKALDALQWLGQGPAPLPETGVDEEDCSVVLGQTKGDRALLNEGDVQLLKGLHDTLRRICERASLRGVKILVDAEYGKYQPAIDVLFTLLAEEFNRLQPATSGSPPSAPVAQPLVYNTIQCSLRRSARFVEASLARARERGYAIGFKVVRGAYVDTERQRWTSLSGAGPAPVWSSKRETDECYNAVAASLVRELARSLDRPAEPALGLLFATHNEDSAKRIVSGLVEAGLARVREDGKVEPGEGVRERLCFAQLFGMADKLSNSLASSFTDGAPLVLKYVPYGELTYVLPYLMRRAVENKSVLSQKGGAADERRRLSGELRRRFGL